MLHFGKVPGLTRPRGTDSRLGWRGLHTVRMLPPPGGERFPTVCVF
jgi:hypothetical protein